MSFSPLLYLYNKQSLKAKSINRSTEREREREKLNVSLNHFGKLLASFVIRRLVTMKICGKDEKKKGIESYVSESLCL